MSLSNYLQICMMLSCAGGANALTWCFWMVQGAAPELDLPLPELDAEHVIVQCDNEICHGNPESRTQTEELWRSLEAPLLAGKGSHLR